MTDTNKAEFFAALCKAQSEFPEVVFDSENPHFKSKFASLAAILGAVRPVLNKHGIALLQVAGWRDSEHYEGGIVSCTTILAHVSGQTHESTLELPSGKAGPQGAAGSLTYAKRLSLQAILGVVGEADDDGNTASETPQRKAAPARPKAPAPVVADVAQTLRNAVTMVDLDRLASLIKGNESFSVDERTYLRSIYSECKRHLAEVGDANADS